MATARRVRKPVPTIVAEGGGGIVKFKCSCEEEFGASFGGEWAPSVTEEAATADALDQLLRHRAEIGCD